MAGRNYHRAVLFDAAGTLIELVEPVGATYARFAREFGVERNAEQLDRAFHRAFAHAPPMAFPDADANQVPELERAWWHRCVQQTFDSAPDRGSDADRTAGSHFETQQQFDRFFDALFVAMGSTSAWRVVEGALELLDELRDAGFGIAIVSNFDFRLPALLDALEIAPRVDVVVLASDVGAAKPESVLFERALALLGAPRGNSVVVGDHPEQDIAGARNAGLRAIDVGSLATLGELVNVIENLRLR
jgi:putative hydrolase of the HAD superfamily